MPRHFSKIVVALGLVLLLVTGCSNQNEKEALKHIENARTYMSQNKPETAIMEYMEAIDAHPSNDTALFELAEIYMVVRKLDKGIRYYNLAAKANSRNPVARIRLAQIYIQMEQLLDARDEISKIFKIDPNSIAAYHLLSSVQVRERDFESAIETLSKASAIDSKNVRTYISLAQLYQTTKRINDAKSSYLTAISVDSSSRQAYMGLIRIYAYEKEFDKIEDLFKQIISTDGIKSQKYTDFARFYEGRRKYDLAEGNYQQAIIEDPQGVLPLIHLAEFHTRRQHKDKAVETLKNALVKNKGNTLILNGLSQINFYFGDIEQAEQNANVVLSIHRDNIDALLQKGKVLLFKNKFKSALEYFERVIALDRLNSQAYYYKAICINHDAVTDRPEQKIFRAALGMLDDPDAFEKDQIRGNLLASITVDPELVEPRIKLAEMYIAESNIKKAREQLEEIFKRRHPDIKILTLIAGLNIIEGQYKEAQKILQLIIEKEPDYMLAYVRLGMLHDAIGEHTKAIEYLRLGFDKDPGMIGIVKMIVSIHVNQKKYGKALSSIEELSMRVVKEKHHYLKNLIGLVYLAKGEEEDAAYYFKKAIELNPEYITAHKNLGDLYFKTKQIPKALNHYKKIELLQPRHLFALLGIAVIYDLKGNTIKAETYYRKVLEINPKHPDAANNLALILSEKEGQLEEALQLSKIANQKKKNDPNLLDTLGWIYYQKGNYLGALSTLKDSLAINPDNPLACYHYAMALYRTKEYEEAREYFKKSIKLDPAFKDADLARKMLN